MTFLIADSGATKTDWLYVDEDDISQIRTQGLHPANLEESSDRLEIEQQIGVLRPDVLFFFGTGCGNPVSDDVMRRFLQPVFPEADIRIKSDLEGSGAAFFGGEDGVVAVLGTGSVCAKIRGGKVVKKSAALGYAIGDEGSAADLGRRILKMYFRRPKEDENVRFIGRKLEGVGYPEMMDRIYRSPRPNRELASIAGRVLKKPLQGELKEMVQTGFSDFIRQQLQKLDLSGEEEVVCTGRVAAEHSDLLLPLLNQNGFPNSRVRHPVITAWRERIKSGNFKF